MPFSNLKFEISLSISSNFLFDFSLPLDKPLELTLGIIKPDLAQHRQNLQQGS